MDRKTHYGTVTEALNKFKEQGYIHDFNLHENCIVCHGQKFAPDEFEIDDVYRYEGITDPADEASVYAIHSKSGLKGVLVTGYGPSADTMSAEILQKLKRK
jgi:Fe2+ or Zn2+ uptake regulation protein